MGEVVYTELGAARRQVLHQRALARLESEGARASELAYHARASGEAEAASRYSGQAGEEAMAVFAVEDAIRHYEQARSLLQEHKPLQTELAASEVEHLYAHLGRAYTNQNAWEQAQEAYEELVDYAQHKPLPALVSLTLNRLAILAAQQSKDRSQVRALLDASRLRSLVLGELGCGTTACWAGAGQHSQWPQGARALQRNQERLGRHQQYVLPHVWVAGGGGL